MIRAATIIKRYGRHTVGPYLKEVIIVELIESSRNKNFVSSSLVNPEYVTITPVNFNSKIDTASADFDAENNRRIIIHEGEIGRQYLIEVIGF
jgi:putative ribosome biogenesis GTPase RsgA